MFWAQRPHSDGHRVDTGRAALCAGVVAAVAIVTAAGAAEGQWRTWTAGALSFEAPPAAAPPGASLALRAQVVGQHHFVCGSTDVVGVNGWLLLQSSGTLRDADGKSIGDFHIAYRGLPIVHAHGVWRGATGGVLTANDSDEGPVPGHPDVNWRRFRVASASGDDAIGRANFIVRLSGWRIYPTNPPCDARHSGATATTSFTGADLFLEKGGGAGPKPPPAH